MIDLAPFRPQYAYWGLFVGIVADNLGLPLPGEVPLLLAAALAPQAGLSLPGIILVAALAAVIGDLGSYLIGRHGGTRLLNLYCRATLCSRDCADTARRFFRRFGSWAVALARFVPGLRAFASPFAGMTRMPYGRFLLADLAGATSWVTLFTGLGAAFGPALAQVLPQIVRFGAVLFLLLVAALLATTARRMWKVRRHGLLRASPDAAEQPPDGCSCISCSKRPARAARDAPPRAFSTGAETASRTLRTGEEFAEKVADWAGQRYPIPGDRLRQAGGSGLPQHGRSEPSESPGARTLDGGVADEKLAEPN